VGIDVTLPALPNLARTAAPYYPAIGGGVASQIAGEGAAALIVHSGAGGLAASVVEAAPGLIGQVVFVDAILPHPGRAWFETAGDAFGAGVRSLAAGGEAAPWDQWFPPGALASLIGDHALRKSFLRELKPTPLAYLDEPAPELTAFDAIPWAYLRLSKVYEDEARLARQLGRPTLRLDLHHLALMTHPREVVSSLRNLIRG
jgi:hypothetical protein